MSNLIPVEKHALKVWLNHLSSNIATSGVGTALLDAQITNLEKTCATLRQDINRKQSKKYSWTWLRLHRR